MDCIGCKHCSGYYLNKECVECFRKAKSGDDRPNYTKDESFSEREIFVVYARNELMKVIYAAFPTEEAAKKYAADMQALVESGWEYDYCSVAFYE